MSPVNPFRAEQAIRRATAGTREKIKAPGDISTEEFLHRRAEIAAKAGRVLGGPNADLKPVLGRIVWANERNKDGTPMPLGQTNPDMAAYGYDHASQCSKLAVVIAKSLGVRDATDLRIVEGVGMFHDLGRSRPWQYAEEHAQLSAQRAEEALHNDPGLWSDPVVRDGVCRLIAQHSLSGSKPTDPRLIAVWDADCFESVRLAPGTREGVVVMNRRMELCITNWAQQSANQARWRQHRGGW